MVVRHNCSAISRFATLRYSVHPNCITIILTMLRIKVER